MSRPPRVNYDQIAPLYDSQPYRERVVDPELLMFLRERGSDKSPALLDIACGTGNQLIANRSTATNGTLVGVDRSIGMLRQARGKSTESTWIQADAAALPCPAHSFDFISCQFAFHHFADKAGMLREAFRVLRCKGRFVLRNLCPQESGDWLYYQYFRQAQLIDLLDFWPPDAIVAVAEGAGLAPIHVELQHLRFEQDLSAWRQTLRRRDICSQLQAIDDDTYEAGIRRLEGEIEAASAPLFRHDHLCIMTIRADKLVSA
jgi:ubiquinone/menaquinone biosynthesis C-methylase UbiE